MTLESADTEHGQPIPAISEHHLTMRTKIEPKGVAYVAGPMSGSEFYNVVEFERVAAEWTLKGYKVLTPFDTNSIVWQRHYGRDFDPRVDKCEYGDPLLVEMFIEDLKAALLADVIVLLEGWPKSKGATREVAVATLFGKDFRKPDGRKMIITPKLDFEWHIMPAWPMHAGTDGGLPA